MDSTRYVIDRLEDGDWAVLESPDGTMLDIPIAWLPTDATEGDLVQATPDTGAATSTVTFTRDTDATESRRARMQKRRDQLSSQSDGPISL